MSGDLPPSSDLPPAGRIDEVAPLVRRLVAPNGGPFTATGTCSYLVGRGQVALIDPGPDDPHHRAALLEALRGETLAAILVTHTHRDHSMGARALSALTGAPTMGAGPHRPARPPRAGETPLEAGADREFVPDRQIQDGEAVSGPDWTLAALATPGHCANHLAFALPEQNLLFSGDHVMAWSTTVVAPPDGSMADYMASLARLVGRPETLALPGHGGAIADPQRLVRAIIQHRRMREAGLLARLEAGQHTIPALVDAVYAGLNPALRGAAALNVLAHLEALVDERRVLCEGEPGLNGRYRAS